MLHSVTCLWAHKLLLMQALIPGFKEAMLAYFAACLACTHKYVLGLLLHEAYLIEQT